MSTTNPNPIDRIVGNRLRQARAMASMSQTDLGDALGITFQQIQKYEKGTNRLSASRLVQAAKTLRTPVTFFFEGTGEAWKHSDLPEHEKALQLAAHSSGALKLMLAFAGIDDPALREAIVTMVVRVANATAPQLQDDAASLNTEAINDGLSH